MAVRNPLRRPPRSEFRIVSAVSCPGVTITSSETPTKAARFGSTSGRYLRYRALRSSVDRAVERSQLLKGALDAAALAVVATRDGYGYDVVRRLRAAGLADIGDASV